MMSMALTLNRDFLHTWRSDFMYDAIVHVVLLYSFTQLIFNFRCRCNL